MTRAHPEERGWQPEFRHKSPLDWGVMLYGGTNPRTGLAQQPLEFSFFAGHYNRRDIEAKARELRDWHKRDHYAIQAPSRKMARLAA